MWCNVVCSQRGDAAVARALLQGGADPLLSDVQGHTALHFAAMGGHAPVCALVLAAAAATLSARDADGRTALHAAAYGLQPGLLV
jgi:ankyrin repeat protein